MRRPFAPILTLALAVASPAAAQAPPDDLVYAYAGGGFLVDSYARRLLLDDPVVLARFAGKGFAPACVAFMRTMRAESGRYDAEFRPVLVAAVRAVAPAEVLTSAAGRPAMPVGGPLLPYRNRIEARVAAIAASLYGRAAAHYRATFEAALAAVGPIAPEGDDYARYGADGSALSVTLRCGIWAGEHRALVFPQMPAGDR